MSEPVKMYADVEISETEDGSVSFLLNGEEMNHQILADSLTITFPSGAASDYPKAHVTMTIAADVNLDLPGAVVSAVRASEEQA